ncbi:hypothetical protein [Herbaspirillum sp. RV1423]|uniref:hypothetical protein n=1 Tax=Herbaspirillum sp. RV1423 TaxID=1443993 RepID=UPI0009DE5DE6|nr:hypothetical protein [Herbaspirillum sp. RV1423]
MHKDTGSWLSAEQAVLPDGTEVENLRLVNKKLPRLSPTPVGEMRSGEQADNHCVSPVPAAEGEE